MFDKDLIFGFSIKHYKEEVFEIIVLLPFHSKTHFYMAYISFKQHTKIFNLDAITNKSKKMMTKNGHTGC